MAQVIMPVINTLEMLAEQLGFAVAMAGELMSGDLKNALVVGAAGASARKNFGKDTAAPKAATGPIDTEGGPSAKDKSKAEKAAIADSAKAEKDAIKDRTAEAMRMLAEEESERKLENASYERRRERATERMLEAANLEVQAAMEKQRMNQRQASMMAGPGGTSSQFNQVRGGAANEILNFGEGTGDPRISDQIKRERDKAQKEQQKKDKKEFDDKVREQTNPLTAEGAQRTMDSRRQEFIKSEAGKEAQGGKTLSDIYTVLNDALSKLVAAPMVN